MWSALSKDLSEFAQSLKKEFSAESENLISLVNKIANDVVGRGEIYAGDEVLLQNSPESNNNNNKEEEEERGEGQTETEVQKIPKSTLQAFQSNDATYLQPFTSEEEKVFEMWRKQSPLSSVQVHQRHPSTSEAGSGGFANEPFDEARQRLLDFNETVLEKYIHFVGEAVSPRKASPNKNFESLYTNKEGDGEGGKAVHDHGTPAKAAAEAEASTPVGGSTEVTPERKEEASPSYDPNTASVLTEDAFFDRYFFRLAQLRALVAHEARERKLKEEEEGKKTEAVKPQNEGQVEGRVEGEAAREGEEGEEGEEGLFPSHFAKRFITATSHLMSNLDQAIMQGNDELNKMVMFQSEGNISDEEDNANISPEELERRLADPSRRRRVERPAPLQEQLEALVHELQEEIRREKQYSQSLRALLEQHGIAAPPSTRPAVDEEAKAPLTVHDTTPKGKTPSPLASPFPTTTAEPIVPSTTGSALPTPPRRLDSSNTSPMSSANKTKAD